MFVLRHTQYERKLLKILKSPSGHPELVEGSRGFMVESNGSITVKTDPLPTSLSTPISPPKRFTNFLTMASPRPVPRYFLVARRIPSVKFLEDLIQLFFLDPNSCVRHDQLQRPVLL